MPTLRSLSSSVSASHGEGVKVLLSGFTKCPGLFYATPAQDGILSRIRIPGGILESKQCDAIADIADQFGGGYVDVTNRANLQIREIHQGINAEVLQRLQDIGLGSANPAVDHIRNIMTSPTAGIDSQELIDTRPFVQKWNQYIGENPHLSGLSAKFSVCFDGGGKVSVRDRLNDITFAAVLVDSDVYFRLYLSIGDSGELPRDMGIAIAKRCCFQQIAPEECLPVLAALADVYLNHIDSSNSRKPRLREVVNSLGWENYLQEVRKNLTPQPPFLPLPNPPLRGEGKGKTFVAGKEESFSPLRFPEELGERSDFKYQHIGIHPQSQPGLFYIGVVLPLGRLESWQMRGLADLALKFGSGSLRLTPWQNVLLTDIPQHQVADVESQITGLKLDSAATSIKGALVACSGSRGCAASATDTKGHALALTEYLENRITLDRPVNIHFSGCVKSCAQHSQGDITLLGVSDETVEGYQVFIGDGDSNQKFGRLLYQYVTFSELPALIERLLKAYQSQRLNSDESFGKFCDRFQRGVAHREQRAALPIAMLSPN
ncbi:assimilatory nitrite reductase (ferredoxin) precursor [Cylindrospermum stagnale PCC 7417]|uniref:Assimilatory nitrite reductase (Ferredoxin) n=1 Tax=Cylindrospermum stagnale PCC 7417 TaxID=56107 RepID=K9WYJ9_9NOST|nr:precorrin-3B synthase [Cylindrospermum stagnale]AFZ25450.1 assimilatory nitrite reductase (ferredoxin) precursor [Cylindrospermum stagnale PCC 7417]